MLRKSKGFKVFIFGVLFNLLESLYFGHGTKIGFNLTPQSIGEFICDDISIILFIAGAYLMAIELYKMRRG